jgi:hypothetical protein
MPTFEFILNGPPVSQNAHQREALHTWRDTVRQTAELAWMPGEAPWEGPLRLAITYFYEGAPVKTQGTLKPIQGALIGLALNDNSQFIEIRFEEKDLFGSFTIPRLTPVLIEGLNRKTEFLHIHIETIGPLEGESTPQFPTKRAIEGTLHAAIEPTDES